ncbi:hypothetical protein DFJ73DRAFT_947321 [Zopfochytrium polystomum]|nr:hypothetical protein DFJ73DRAFT_947321 [Zopfochytrium polystomum]
MAAASLPRQRVPAALAPTPSNIRKKLLALAADEEATKSAGPRDGDNGSRSSRSSSTVSDTGDGAPDTHLASSETLHAEYQTLRKAKQQPWPYADHPAEDLDRPGRPPPPPPAAMRKLPPGALRQHAKPQRRSTRDHDWTTDERIWASETRLPSPAGPLRGSGASMNSLTRAHFAPSTNTVHISMPLNPKRESPSFVPSSLQSSLDSLESISSVQSSLESLQSNRLPIADALPVEVSVPKPRSLGPKKPFGQGAAASHQNEAYVSEPRLYHQASASTESSFGDSTSSDDPFSSSESLEAAHDANEPPPPHGRAHSRQNSSRPISRRTTASQAAAPETKPDSHPRTAANTRPPTARSRASSVAPSSRRRSATPSATALPPTPPADRSPTPPPPADADAGGATSTSDESDDPDGAAPPPATTAAAAATTDEEPPQPLLPAPAPPCPACRLAVRRDEPAVAALGHSWHLDCFRCDDGRACGKAPLRDAVFYQKGRNVYCAACWEDAYCPRCFQCGAAIVETQTQTQFKGKPYHAKCFACSACARALPPMVQCVAVDAKQRFCLPCYQALHGPRCKACGDVLQDEQIAACGGAFHVGCLKCDTCGKELRRAFFERDGLAFCSDHFHGLKD